MAKWCVLVLLIAQNVLANDSLSSCDMCIRKGGAWCLQNTPMGHCIEISTDTGCSTADTEKLIDISKDINGDLFKPIFAERTLSINAMKPHLTKVTFTSGGDRKVSTSENDKLDITIEDTKCNTTECTVEISTRPTSDFCAYFEYVDIKIKVQNFTEEATIRYHVPCSCPCTKRPEWNSEKCSFRGNYSCGICTCEFGWNGDKCEEACPQRGDDTQINERCLSEKNNKWMDCYGNGDCACDVCKCFSHGPGSQYFDKDEQCADVCTQTASCSGCLRNGTLGECHNCQRELTMLKFNETVVDTEFDEYHRKTWVHCMEHVDDCDFNYYAMRSNDHFYAMLKESCNTRKQGLIAGTTSTKVPLIIGILGIVAVIATVSGILLWKHMNNSLPALPTSVPQYGNLAGEDCTGVNPLYKPPTSSFKNPTYGKL